jgi:hypothetical protein
LRRKSAISQPLGVHGCDLFDQESPERYRGAIPTMGWLRWTDPVEPWKVASPKLKMPPSDATNR